MGGGQLVGGVNISNERVISGNCSYPPGYLPSDPTREKSIILGSLHSGISEGLAFHSLAWFPENYQLSIPPSHFHHRCRPGAA